MSDNKWYKLQANKSKLEEMQKLEEAVKPLEYAKLEDISLSKEEINEAEEQVLRSEDRIG